MDPTTSLFVPTGPDAPDAPDSGSDDAHEHPGDADLEHWMPTELARGPWSPDALHGGPVAALCVRALERLPAPAPMRLARLTVELLRPVPVAPLWLSAQVRRDGAKVGLLEAALGRSDDGQVVALARAQRIRTADVDFPDGADDDPPALPAEGSAHGFPTPEESGYRAFHNAACEHRLSDGVFGIAGSAFDWIRLAVGVVPGEQPSGWQRAAAAADFANGISSVVPFDGTAVFINPDLTVHLWREPVGEWVGLDAVTRTSPQGIGASDAVLWDERGRIGHANQSLLLDLP